MLIEFSVGNYLSFKEIVTFSMLSSSIREHRDTHVFQPQKKLKLLKSAILYGANASGKSNLFKAMSFMSNFVRNSSKDSQVDENINTVPFKLSTETTDKPSFFEIIFMQDNIRYRYGFEVDVSKVKQEWLFYTPKKQEIKLFERNQNSFEIESDFKEGKGLDEKTRDNALFLSVVAQFNGEKSISILKWFNKLNNISGLNDKYQDFTTSLLEKGSCKETFLELIRIADAGIEDLTVNIEEFSFNKYPKEIQQPLKTFRELLEKSFSMVDDTITNIITTHKKYDENNKFVSFEEFNMNDQESHGTKKLFSLLGPIIDTLHTGKILVIDEFDSRLHTLLSSFIVKLFNSNEKNPNNAQLIINTHDTNLLNNKLFRRDQIWFTEKNRYGATNLYSLVEYNRVRNDASFEKDYLLGKFGAIPFISDFKFSCK